jgi:hypothetical protein
MALRLALASRLTRARAKALADRAVSLKALLKTQQLLRRLAGPRPRPVLGLLQASCGIAHTHLVV